VYLAFPWHVVGFEAAAVEGDEEVSAAVAVGEGEFGVGHLFVGRRCRYTRYVSNHSFSLLEPKGCLGHQWRKRYERELCMMEFWEADVRPLGDEPWPRPTASLMLSVTVILLCIAANCCLKACGSWVMSFGGWLVHCQVGRSAAAECTRLAQAPRPPPPQHLCGRAKARPETKRNARSLRVFQRAPQALKPHHPLSTASRRVSRRRRCRVER